MLERSKMAAPKARSAFYDDRFRSRSCSVAAALPVAAPRVLQFCYLRPCPIAIADRSVGNDQSATAENINVGAGPPSQPMLHVYRSCFPIKPRRSARVTFTVEFLYQIDVPSCIKTQVFFCKFQVLSFHHNRIH